YCQNGSETRPPRRDHGGREESRKPGRNPLQHPVLFVLCPSLAASAACAVRNPELRCHRTWSCSRVGGVRWGSGRRGSCVCEKVASRRRKATCFCKCFRRDTLVFLFWTNSVANSGSSARSTALNNSFLSSVKITACSLPRDADT